MIKVRQYSWVLTTAALIGLAAIFWLSWLFIASSGGGKKSSGLISNILKAYMPRRMCMYSETPVIWIHFVSDALIAFSYYSIPLALVYFVRRRKDIVFGWIFWLFALFILGCGTTHVFGVLDLWRPYYRLDGVIKFATAIVSVITAIALWPLLPKALALPSRALLEQELSDRTVAHDRADLALRERKADLDEAQGLARLGSWRWDVATDAVTGTDELYRIFGLDPTAGPFPSFQAQDGKLYTHDNWTTVNDALQVTLRNGQGFQLDVQAFRDGQPIWVTTRSEPTYDASGKLIGLRGTVQDITERVRALANERAARSEAEAASRLKDEFLSTLSHELRTPLNAILGWSEILRRGDCPADDVKEGLAVIIRNARAQAQLVEDLLDMSRIVSGKLRIETQDVNITGVIHTAIESVTPAAQAKDIHLQTSLAPDQMLHGDPARLLQVVWNLLSNAVKFTPRGGSVTVGLQHVDQRIEISVADTGPGIPADFLPYVFDRFRQADGGTTRRHGGLGLGLAIVRNIVELHGGTVRAASPGPNQGATFTVELPLPSAPVGILQPVAGDKAEASTTRKDPNYNPDILQGITVLVVEDEPDTRDLIRRTLEQFRARVLLAGSGREAFDLLLQQRPDVIVSDIGMPDEDGYALIRRIRALPAADGGQTPAAALTAFARSEDRRRALLAGYQAHIPKPADPEELVTVIASLAGKISPI